MRTPRRKKRVKPQTKTPGFPGVFFSLYGMETDRLSYLSNVCKKGTLIMQIKNTPTTYGAGTKFFHWTIALLIVFMLCLGFYMGGLEGGLQKLKLYGLHKSIGVTVLMLALARLGWHLYSKKPGFVPEIKWWERHAAHAMHIFLYIGMIGMPLSGWLLSSAAGRSVQFFGLFTLPDLIPPDGDTGHIGALFRGIHWYTAWALVIAIPAHAGAALKHHFLNKDATLARMIPLNLLKK